MSWCLKFKISKSFIQFYIIHRRYISFTEIKHYIKEEHDFKECEWKTCSCELHTQCSHDLYDSRPETSWQWLQQPHQNQLTTGPPAFTILRCYLGEIPLSQSIGLLYAARMANSIYRQNEYGGRSFGKNVIICIISHDYRSQIYAMRMYKASRVWWNLTAMESQQRQLGGHKSLKTIGY